MKHKTIWIACLVALLSGCITPEDRAGIDALRVLEDHEIPHYDSLGKMVTASSGATSGADFTVWLLKKYAFYSGADAIGKVQINRDGLSQNFLGTAWLYRKRREP